MTWLLLKTLDNAVKVSSSCIKKTILISYTKKEWYFVK